MASNFTHVAGLFNTKRAGMLVGTSREADLEALIGIIKKAKAEGRGVTFFVFENDSNARVAARLTVDVERERTDRPAGPARRPIGGGTARGEVGGRTAPARPAVKKSPEKSPLDDVFSGDAETSEEDSW